MKLSQEKKESRLIGQQLFKRYGEKKGRSICLVVEKSYKQDASTM